MRQFVIAEIGDCELTNRARMHNGSRVILPG